MAGCPAGPTRRQVAAARRARRDLRRYQASLRRGPAQSSKKKRPQTARQKARNAATRRRLRRDRRAINRVRDERQKRKACLRAHRYAQRTRNGQAGFVTAKSLEATRKAVKARAGRG
jgi:hypothetical protein